MRKLIVSNLSSLDGYYEGKGRNLGALFDYFHADYAGDQNFDYYNTERIRAADTLLLSGHKSFLDNKDYWTSVPNGLLVHDLVDEPHITACYEVSRQKS